MREPTSARERLSVVGALLAIAGVAWAATDLRMAGMDAGPGTDLGGLSSYLSMWIVMMFPASA